MRSDLFGRGSLWMRAVWLLLACLGLVFVPVLLVAGPVWGLAALSFCLLLMLGWHLFHLGQLLNWQAGQLDAPLPRGRGVWEIAFAGLHRRARTRLGRQQSLSDTLERFRLAFQALPDGVIAFDGLQHIEWINERAARHFALAAEADRGLALTNLIRQPEFVAYLAGGHFGEPLIYREGRVKNLVLLLQIIPYDKDHYLLVSRDISQLERMENMRRDFIANISHELKTPLTVVAGFSEMLADGYEDCDPAEIKHYLSLIHEQNLRMQRLIQDLLTLSALESGMALNEERIEVAPMLHSLLDEARLLSGGKHEFSLSVETPSVLCGCANELRSAFGNLVSNAVRYTPPGGKIALAWHVQPEGAEFTVTDTGIGIATQHLPRLTERFYRVDRSRSRDTGGTGLGLAIVKHVLTRHQAVLDVESEPGHGSRFIARFPASRLL